MSNYSGKHSLLILKFPYASRYGGGEKHTLDLADSLRSKGYRVVFAGSCPILKQEFRKRQFSVVRFWAGREPVTPFTVALFPFTALFVFVGLTCLLLTQRLRGIRMLYCLSLTEKLLLPFVARLFGMKVFFMEHRMLDQWLIRNPLRPLFVFQSWFSEVITVSKALHDQCRQIGVPARRIHVIHNGVELEKFPWPRQRTSQSQAFVVGAVVGLERGKGVAYLLKALALLKNEIPFLRGLVVGSGPERQQLMWLAQQLGLRESVQWVGFQREAYKWYAYFDVLALPSIKGESFGIVLIEAMAAGVPVVATNIGGVPEVVADGRTGLLVPPGNSEALAEKIGYLYHHREHAKALANEARKEVELRFRHDTMIRYFIRLFEDINP